jgi:hypothetical protein
MKQDEMTICECVEYLDSMVGDVQFGDGARFCVESEQIEFVEN